VSRRPGWGAGLAGCLLLGVASGASAGAACTELSLSVERFRHADALARQLHEALDRDVREVAIVARVGSDLSRHGLRFSHAAFALREAPGGAWRVVHLLNHCGRATGALYREGLINFFLDDPFEYAALVLVPDPGLQHRLAQELAGDTPRALFEAHYDMLAHPRSLQAQNSNQWLLEVLAAAQAPPGSVRSRADAQAWLAGRGFHADTVRLSAMERLGARLFAANVGFAGQPVEARMQGRIEVVSVRALARYLEQGGALAANRILAVPGAVRVSNSGATATATGGER